VATYAQPQWKLRIRYWFDRDDHAVATKFANFGGEVDKNGDLNTSRRVDLLKAAKGTLIM
jgi:hypothetical protein